jgi:hypothetical protein
MAVLPLIGRVSFMEVQLRERDEVHGAHYTLELLILKLVYSCNPTWF